MAHATPALEMRDVTKRVRDGQERRTVLEGISLTVGRGERVVLRGPSGSGKTTLLALAGAMLSPTSGEVALDGEPTSRLREVHRASVRRRTVGFVFQDLQLIEGMTAWENVLLPRVPDGITRADETRATELLTHFGIVTLAKQRVRQMSGGERQRVALARALVGDPKLLLLDEPTAHLDETRVRALAEELARLAAEGRALLVATHDPRIADVPGARVLDLAEGRIVSHPS
jgi:putative ABC transport system ATP-binding protein